MGAHALLSASSSHRWLHCTPSARLEGQFANTTSAFAQEGTDAHALAEHKLKQYLGKRSKRPVSDFDSDDFEHYTDVYVDYAIEQIEQVRQESKDPIVLIEQRLDYSHYVQGGYGTGDLVIVTEGIIDIVDLKFGKGVAVSADDNPQMKLYALGALSLFDSLYDINTVRMTIVQPRLESISIYEIPVEELTDWAENILKPAAQLAWRGEGEFCPSQYICKFCRAKSTCRARTEKNLEMARFEFRQAPLLTKDEVAEILAQAEAIAAWCKDIWSWAEARAIDGDEFEGFKIVEGRSNRTYGDEQAVIEKLTEAGYSESDIFIRNLKGITALEKALGKKEFSGILGGLITKPPGKYTMVTDSDKRRAIALNTTAAADFKENI